MNILHINKNYSNSRIHHNIAAEMNMKPGVQGRIFYPTYKKSREAYNIDFLDNIKCLHGYEKVLFAARNRHLVKIAEKTYNIKEFDTILAHSLFSNGYLAMCLGKKYGISYSVIITNTDMNVYFAKMPHLRKRGLNILSNADKIIFSSIAYCEELIDKYVPEDLKDNIKKKSAAIPFGIDNFWIENRKERREKEPDKNVRLLYAGKINRNKNLTLTLRACEKLTDMGFNIRYTVVGDVSHSSGFKILDELKSRDFVHYVPGVPFKDLLKYYRDNDIFVMPSITESFGLVYAEALTQGMPIIYTKGQGFDRQFEDKTVGVAVRSDSVDDLVNAVEYIVNNYNRLSKAAYEKSRVFSWPAIAERFLAEIGGEVYEGLSLNQCSCSCI